MSKDIRKILLDEIKNIQSGKTDIRQSKAVIKAAAQVVYSDRLEIEKEVHILKMRKFVKRK